MAPRRRAVEVGDSRDQLGPDGRRELGRRGRGRGAQVGDMVDQRPVGFVADRGDERDRATRRGAHDDFLVEAPQVLERAAPARHDQHVRPRREAAGGERVEPVDRRRHLGRRGLPLHPHRPHQDPNRETVGKPMQNVADDRAGRRGDDADDLGQERNLALAGLVEQALFGQLLAPRLEQRHQRADPGEFELLDHDLVARLAGKCRQPPGRDDFETFLGLDLHAGERGAPDDRVEPRAGVLQAEIGMAGRMRTAVAGDFAAHAHIAEPVLDRALERVRQLADGDFGRVARANVRFGHRRTMPDRAGPGERPRARRRAPHAGRRWGLPSRVE